SRRRRVRRKGKRNTRRGVRSTRRRRGARCRRPTPRERCTPQPLALCMPRCTAHQAWGQQKPPPSRKRGRTEKKIETSDNVVYRNFKFQDSFSAIVTAPLSFNACGLGVIVFACMLVAAIADPKPGVLYSAAYTAPVAAAYTAPVIVLACMLVAAFADPKPGVLYSAAYTAPVAAAYTAPVVSAAYTAPLAYSAYTAPLAAFDIIQCISISVTTTNMFKYFVFICMMAVAFADPKPGVLYSAAYTAPVAAAYTAPVVSAAYTAPLAYSAYSAPLAAYSAYPYASPYAAYYLRNRNVSFPHLVYNKKHKPTHQNIILAALFAVAAAKPGIHSVAYSAPLVAAPVAAAYTAPVAAAYAAPVAAAYTAPVAAAYTAPVAAAYTAYSSPYAAAYTASVAAYNAYSAPLVTAAYKAPVLLK
ncbi:hypothetical protein HW555_004380, partial [Spodoptera exigua]